MLISARSGQYGDFRHDTTARTDRWVWNVVFRGTFRSSGGAAPSPGVAPSPLPLQHSVSVLIDYSSGAFVSASVPAGGD